ncbi:FAD/NAD(P)-binding domain-containing protein [Viridothelium virens]|uniref:FAD/NAD(P)-binding domain-containing protein n=1 Tax=Viridothelium virens TaxID=1048519 RepID=A0A6A6HJB4_VIRVR|nr:FAD/NAD(P)-binding domain-containing protein [Viridothelium virens]
MHVREAPGFSEDGKFVYGPPGSSGYDIPDIIYDNPNNRKIRVLTIGAGVSGILLAYKIQKELQNIEHVIYEKNAEVGGTWIENRYPGCACDIPSHAYAFPFALNPDWTRWFSHAPEILEYLKRVVDTFGLRKYMTFNAEVTGCYWQEEKGKWKVKLRDTVTGEQREDECDVLLHAAGLLNSFKWPQVEGIESFKGRLVHTAHWPADYQAEQWKKDRVAVIGSGASSIQTVPTMQPFVKHMDVFIRTGVWFIDFIGGGGGSHDRVYSAAEKSHFRHSPDDLVAAAKSIEDVVNGFWGSFYSDTRAQAQEQEKMRARTAEHLKDPRLLEGFNPNFGLGCRRITPGDPYMAAVQKENVDVHFTPAAKATEKGIVGGDGIEREVDTIVCATGFDTTYRPRFPIVGRDGVDLAEKWKDVPESYLSVCVPGFPNMVQMLGPTFPVENGSVMGGLVAVSGYVLEWLRKMQRDGVKAWAPRQDITDQFNDHTQEWITHTVWKDSCRSWYKNNDTGRVNAVWPGATLHFNQIMSRPRWEDFHISYIYKNPWAALGMGWTMEWTLDMDKSPYLNTEALDPLWLEKVRREGKEEDKKVEAAKKEEATKGEERSDSGMVNKLQQLKIYVEKILEEHNLVKSSDTAADKDTRQDSAVEGPHGEKDSGEIDIKDPATKPTVEEAVKGHETVA